jgi:predicted DsbA family dithiol-disulfide isomerase
MTKPLVKIEVVSDVVCPWCYIGKRRLEKALDRLGNTYQFDLSFLPFELNPAIPIQGVDQKQYLTKKFGGEDRYEKITRQVTEIAAREGLTFDFNKQSVSPNTRQAHRLIWFAKKFNKQAAVNEALLKAYFELGMDLSKDENLVTLAAQSGLDPETISSFLLSEEGTKEVIELEQLSYQRGISGVPFFIFNNQYGVSGAQATDTFVQVIQQVSEAAVVG